MLAYYFAFPLILAMPAAAIVTVAVSLVIGAACLRLRGPYVALLTLAIAQVIYLVVVNDTACFTNPPSGLPSALRRRSGLLALRRPGSVRCSVRNSTSRTIRGTGAGAAGGAVFDRHHPRAAGPCLSGAPRQPGYAISRGISKFKYQLWVFGLSAFFTGLAVRFLCRAVGVVGPIVFSLAMLLFLLSMIVVGGMGTIWGPLLGGAL